ncbi:MAG: outer membrane beta-barrel protein, partial [Parafilimonas sp.]
INLPHRQSYEASKKRNISTNYLIFDLGFANYNDKTDYSASQTANFAEPGLEKHDLKLIAGKSSNVNIWLFMQKLNITDHVLNLKYGLGLNMYNYRYNSNISFQDKAPYVIQDSIDFSKNKLYVGYATIPLMININPTPNRHHGINFSAGVSAGYRIGTHSKQISDERGKVKNHDDFDLRSWMVAYVAEIGLGPVRIYGSYSMNTLFEDAKQYPYTIGFRFSNW